MSETPEKPAYPSHMEKAPAGLFEHYCMHEGCKAWGSFGFDKRYGLEWYWASTKVMRTLLDREITKGGIWADKFGLFAEWRFWEHCSG